jgi:nicotinamide riboside transporter PnuC
MRWLELFGTIFAASGFGLLAMGYLKIGFTVGVLSCALLLPVFWVNQLYFLLTLQAYFSIMNVIGIWRN